MKLRPIVVYGAGGHGREVAALIEDANSDARTWELLGFLSDNASEHGQERNGYGVLGGAEWLLRAAPDVGVVLAIGSSAQRYRVARTLDASGRAYPILRHPSAQLTRHATLGAGTMLMGGCIVTVNVVVGRFGILNRACSVSHDCRLGDFVTLAPGVMLGGGVKLEEGCDVGIAACAIPGVTVGAWSIVGGGAAIVRSLPNDCTAVGVPARIVRRREAGWQSKGGSSHAV